MLFVAEPSLYHLTIVLSVPEDSAETEVARGLFAVSCCYLGFLTNPPKLGIFLKFRFN